MPDHVTGFVDGVYRGDVTGWIVNHDQPARLEEVVCYGVGGQRRFHAFHHHQGISKVVGRRGRFGFAIPLCQVAQLGGRLHLTNAQGQPLDSGDVTVPPGSLYAAAPSGPAYVFLHIQKTAGTAIAAAMQRVLPKSQFANLYHFAPWLGIADLAALHMHERRNLRMVCGHLHFGIDYLLGQESRYVTFLREPMARIASHYWHLRRTVPALQVAGKPVAHSALVNEAMTDEFDNLQTRMVAGTAEWVVPRGAVGANEVELALSNVQLRFAFVGFSERADADFQTLCRMMGLEAGRLPQLNVGEGMDRGDADFARLDWDRIRAHNRSDIVLYETLRARDGAGLGGCVAA